jgi:hypothetical protein
MSKVDIGPIVRDHIGTLVEKPSDRISWVDVVLMYGLPPATGVASGLLGWEISSTGNLIAATSVFAALLFALLVAVLGYASELADRAVATGTSRRLIQRAGILRSLGSNVAYATLMSVIAAAVLVVADQWKTEAGNLPIIWSAIVVGFLFHLGMTFLMVLKRSYRFLRGQIDIAVTGDG